MRRWGTPIFSVALVALATAAAAQGAHDALVAKHAAANGVPESLVRRVIWIESRGNPRVVSKGNFGLMQIRLGTARAMGYSGSARGLLDADTNMTYAVKYLAGAYRAAGCNASRAISYYQRGYHRARRARCGPPAPSQTQLAGLPAQAKPAVIQAAMVEPASLPAPSTEGLKPKLVRTLAISKGNLEGAPTRTVARLEPEPVPLPPVPGARPKPLPMQSTAKLKPDPTTTQTVARLEPELVPLPPLKRPGLQPPSDQKLQAAYRSASKRARARTKVGAPVDLLSFLKNLMTPEKNSRTRAYRSHAQARR